MPNTNIDITTPVEGNGNEGKATIIPIRTQANPLTEYVAGGSPFFTGTPLRVLPWSVDDISIAFGPELYDRMMVDDEVSASVGTLVSGALSDGIEVVPAVPDKLDARYGDAAAIADFCARSLAALDPMLDDFARDMAHGALVHGHKIAEQVYRLETQGEDAGKLVLDSLKVKSRRSCAFVVDRYLNVVGILAQRNSVTNGAILAAPILADPLTGTNLTENNDLLPREKFAVLTWSMADSDPRGASILRPAYRPWWKKVQTDPEHMRWAAQFASPSLIGTTEENAQPYPATNADGTPQLDAYGNQLQVSPEQTMANTLAGFKNGTAVAFPFGSTTKPLEVHSDGHQFIAMFDHFDRAIAKAILHQTLATGEGQHDSRAAAGVHQDILDQLIKRLKRTIAHMLKKDVLTPLVRYNFGDAALSLVPDLSLGDTVEADKAPQQTSLAAMWTAGMMTPSQLPDAYADVGLPPSTPQDLDALAVAWHAKQELVANPPPPPPMIAPPGVPIAPNPNAPPAAKKE